MRLRGVWLRHRNFSRNFFAIFPAISPQFSASFRHRIRRSPAAVPLPPPPRLRDDVTEKELFWNVDVLCALCIRAGPALLEHEAAVCDVLTGLWGSSAKVRVRLGAKLLKRLLQCLTTTYHLDLRMAAPAEWRTAAFQTGHGQHWGRRCTREAAAVDWHVPTAPEVRCAVRLVNRYYAASRAVLEAYLTGGDAAGAGAGAGAGADEEDTSPLNRCRCALKQIKKLVQGAVALLPDPPDGEFPRAPDAVPNPRLHCSMISEQVCPSSPLPPGARARWRSVGGGRGWASFPRLRSGQNRTKSEAPPRPKSFLQL